eukprot:854061-Prymnesium_polylepis.1
MQSDQEGAPAAQASADHVKPARWGQAAVRRAAHSEFGARRAAHALQVGPRATALARAGRDGRQCAAALP